MLNFINKTVAQAQKAIKNATEHPEEIPIGGSRMRVLKKLGEGGFAFVYLVEDIKSGRRYALKRMLAADAETNALAKMEVNVMRAFKGAPNLVKYYASTLRSLPNKRAKEYYILMEFCQRGALLDEITDRIEQKRPYKERQICRMFYQTCRGVRWFHTRTPPIQHRDLKIENLLMTADGTIKICDFGSCTTRSRRYESRSEILQEQDRIQRFTTNCYMAPEMADLYKRELINEKVDIWALACILYTFAFFIHPFQDKGPLAIINGAYKVPANHRYSEHMVRLLKILFTVKPKKRPDIDTVLRYVKEWEAFLSTGKTPSFDGKKSKKKSAHKSGSGSDGSDSSSDSEEERRKKRKKKKKKKEERKRKKETAATSRPRRPSDDFDVDWSQSAGGAGTAAAAPPAAKPASDADFDVDWGEAEGSAARGGATPSNAKSSAQSGSQSWDPFAQGGGGAASAAPAKAKTVDIFSVLGSGSAPAAPAEPVQTRAAPTQASAQRRLRRPSGSGAMPAPLPRAPSGMGAATAPPVVPRVPSGNGFGGVFEAESPVQAIFGAPQQQHSSQGQFFNADYAQMARIQQQQAAFAQQQEQMRREQERQSVASLNDEFAAASFGTSTVASQPAASAPDPFAAASAAGSDPFSVGIVDHTPKNKGKSSSEKKNGKRDVFAALDEFEGF